MKQTIVKIGKVQKVSKNDEFMLNQIDSMLNNTIDNLVDLLKTFLGIGVALLGGSVAFGGDE